MKTDAQVTLEVNASGHRSDCSDCVSVFVAVR